MSFITVFSHCNGMKLEIDFKEKKNWKIHKYVIKQHTTKQPMIQRKIKRDIKKYLKAKKKVLFTLLPHHLSLSSLPFYFISPLLFISVLWKNLASKHWKDGYFEILVCHLFGLPVFPIKSYSLPLKNIYIYILRQMKMEKEHTKTYGMQQKQF